MRAINVMFDTLSRRFLSTYGNQWVKTPNFERLKEKTTQFDNFYSGSLPCIPARRELHTGRYNFLHRGWGPLEPFDDSAIALLGQHGVHTHIVTDHQHYWEDGGATYLPRYSTWEGFRGQEGDEWVPIVDPQQVAIPERVTGSRQGPMVPQSFANRTKIQTEADFPSIKTIQAGLDFIENNVDNDQWFLQIESFDPHEPFHVPDRFTKMYEDVPNEPYFDWPAYAPVVETDEEKRQVIIRYAALITMCDEYLGKVLDLMDQYDMWQDTMLIVNTDHGFLMGEHNWWGKVMQPAYQEVAHIPYYMSVPGMQPATTERLAQMIDVGPTLLDYFQVDKPKDMLGQSLIPVVKENVKIHDAMLFGYFSGQVNIVDEEHLYMRGPIRANNTPMNEYTLMPTQMKGFLNLGALKQATLFDGFAFTKGLKVLKTPVAQNIGIYFYGNKLYDIQNDEAQEFELDDVQLEATMLEKMRQLMLENDAPVEQYERLGLSKDHMMTTETLLQQRAERSDWGTFESVNPLTPDQVAKVRMTKSILSADFFAAFMTGLNAKKVPADEIDALIVSQFDQILAKRGLPKMARDMMTVFVKSADRIQ